MISPKAELKKELAKVVAKAFGKRCKVKDYEDFPEMVGDPLANRCPTCLAYEKLDAFVEDLLGDD